MLLNLFFLYSIFFKHCLSFCPFSFSHYVVCSSIYDFWLPLWYLQTFLTMKTWHIYGKNKLDSQNTTDTRFNIYLILHWDTIILHWYTIKIVSIFEMKNNNGIKKKCSEHVVIGYFGTFVFDSLNCLLYVHVYIYSTVYLFMCKLCFVIMHIIVMRKYIKINKIYIV
jgi:hypothetical protein